MKPPRPGEPSCPHPNAASGHAHFHLAAREKEENGEGQHEGRGNLRHIAASSDIFMWEVCVWPTASSPSPTSIDSIGRGPYAGFSRICCATSACSPSSCSARCWRRYWPPPCHN